ncbi:MAG: DUF1156 domain-containing protein [Candidatus Omnitrophica bacterium]|nr:DUF1156 domain-containing protein [Candidatus Omnitrophota bacterium]
MTDKPLLIERAFPLKQASLDSVHEKNVRHGHISTLHIWPARRPLAACRAALIATLLPDPGTPEERRKLCEKIGGNISEDPLFVMPWNGESGDWHLQCGSPSIDSGTTTMTPDHDLG